MIVFGICKNCHYRQTVGGSGTPKHLYCAFKERILETLRLKACPHYVAAIPPQIPPFNVHAEPEVMKGVRR